MLSNSLAHCFFDNIVMLSCYKITVIVQVCYRYVIVMPNLHMC